MMASICIIRMICSLSDLYMHYIDPPRKPQDLRLTLRLVVGLILLKRGPKLSHSILFLIYSFFLHSDLYFYLNNLYLKGIRLMCLMWRAIDRARYSSLWQ